MTAFRLMTAAALAFANAAAAQSTGTPMCAPRADLVAQIEKKYGERRVGAGLQNRGAVTEVFASADTGTWTILVTRPDGTACAVAAGEAWMTETRQKGDAS